MIRVAVAGTDKERDDALAVRIAVFVDEQGIPREEELDEYDEGAVHCVAYEGGEAVGAGRLVLLDGYGKIGRMATLAEYRGRGVGAGVLRTLEDEGAVRGVREFRLSAQVTARRFYERAGYAATGDIYDEVGIPHVAMTKTI